MDFVYRYVLGRNASTLSQLAVLGLSLGLFIATGRNLLTRFVSTRDDPGFAPKSRYGLVPVEVFDPKRTGEGIDLIFVHGLGSNPDTTWEARNASYKQPNENVGNSSGKEYINWVVDFLHDDLPAHLKQNSRAFFFNYNSYYDRDAVVTRRKQLGLELLHEVVDLARKNPDRNFIFVGHSYGGLVIKEALIGAHTFKSNLDVDIHKQTKAVVFLGTPHRGSSAARLGAIRAQLYNFLFLYADPEIVKAVQYDSLELQDMHRDFESISSDMKLINFFEMKKTKTLWILRSYVVTEQSSTLDRASAETRGLDTDHTGLNKYKDRDSNYIKVKDKLVQLMESICDDAHFATMVNTLPDTPSKFYAKRPILSRKLEESLAKPGNIVALIGLGGIGKTQLAQRYAKDNVHRYNVIFWIDASSEAKLRSSFNSCAQSLQLDVPRTYTSIAEVALKDDPAVKLILAWLKKRDHRFGEWLFILDNFDELEMNLSDVIPSNPSGNVIITGRNLNCNPNPDISCRSIKVQKMESLEAQSLLLQYIGLDVSRSTKEVYNLSLHICEKLDYLPLAIHLAGAYINSSYTGDADIAQEGAPESTSELVVNALEKYLKNFKAHKNDLLRAETIKGWSSYDQTIWTVWDTSLNMIEEKFPTVSSRRLLTFLAYMEAAKVPENIFDLAARELSQNKDEGGPELPCWLSELLILDGNAEWDKFKFENSLRPLQRYGLVEYTRSEGSYNINMHALVRWKAKLDGRDTGGPSWASMHGVVFLNALKHAWDTDTLHQIWDFFGLYSPSPDVLLSIKTPKTLTSLHIIGELNFHVRRWKDSHTLQEQLVEATKQMYGQNHSCAIASMLNVAAISPTQQPFTDGDDPFRKNIQELARIGEECTPCLTNFALSRMASACAWDGRFREAKELQEKVIQRERNTVGDPFFLTVSHIQLYVYGQLERNDLESAESVQNMAISRVVDVYGEDHFETLFRRANLLPIYKAQGDQERVKELQSEMADKWAGWEKAQREELEPEKLLQRSLLLNYRKGEAAIARA